MASRGHQVEVFSGTIEAVPSRLEIEDYFLNLIPAATKEEFRINVLPAFIERHQLVSFQIIESPEYGADALNIKKAFPEIPLTLKLHTPSFLTGELNDYKKSWTDKSRFIIGGLLQGKISKPYWVYKRDEDVEFELFNLAETASSYSRSLAEIVSKRWVSNKLITVIPPPFKISQRLLNVNSPKNLSMDVTVTFIGKLEKRKGVLDLMNAIPGVLKKIPETRFCFVGKALSSPEPNTNMESYIKKKLKNHLNSLIFTGFKEYDGLPEIIEKSQICIFPSLWEAFGFVCLESMAAGRAVIGTNNGGMAEIIEHNIDGILIPQNSPQAIQKAIIDLILHTKKRESIGLAARKKILKSYKAQEIGSMTEDLYRKTISFYE